MRISKYQPWTEYLQNHPDMFCRMSFSDIERLIGDNLPDTCKTYATVFWNNSNGHYAKHWLKADRIVVEYSISQNYAIFKKDPIAAREHLSKAKQPAKQDLLSKPKVDMQRRIATFPCDSLIAASQKYMNEISADEHARYLSWEHCHGYFIDNYRNPTAEQLDLMCLHLAWYLASWGMLRGGSFLLQKDYRIHLPVVNLLVSQKYHELYDCSIETLAKSATCKKIMELSAAIVDLYKGLTIDLGDGEGKIASDTLITKILLGTIGCTPAYDRYFKSGLALTNVAQQRYGEKSMHQLIEYYMEHYEELETYRMLISQNRITYTPMKILDMCFWQIGFDHDTK